MDYLWAFLIGGLFCAIGQVLMDFTKLTPARILVAYVTGGVLLGALGLYKPLIDLAGCGATVPLTGFGYLLYNGVREQIDKIRLPRHFHRGTYRLRRRHNCSHDIRLYLFAFL